MALQFCSFASGSSGNCSLVKTDRTALLVDTGITGKRILGGLADMGVEPARLSGILITHEHVDHVRSLRMLSRKAENARVYASEGTLEEVGDKIRPEKAEIVCSGEEFQIGIFWSEPLRCLTMQRNRWVIPLFMKAVRSPLSPIPA